jgi:fermentation-respiration switch protein FrsA (DUF1100 family)
MKKWLKITLTIIAVLILLVFGALAVVTRSQAIDLITHPMSERLPLEETPADYGLPYEDVTVTSADGIDLVGWYVPSENRAAIIAQHGYKSDRRDMFEQAAIIHRHGYGVLFTTIRSHDLNEGEQIAFGYREMPDLEAWYQYLLTREDVDADKIGILGNSMGGSLVIQYAAQNENIKAVVGHTAFSSLSDTVATSVKFFTGLPPFPFAPMILFWVNQELGFNTSVINAKVWIAEICPRPVFLMQGGLDPVVETASGERLYEAACEPKEFWYEPTMDEHTEFDTYFPEEYEKRVVGFLDRYVLGE